MHTTKILIAIAMAVPVLYLALPGCQSGRKVDFSAEVKPILNKHCISCHGGVKQNGGFSVLFREEALGVTKSGKPAIIPGNAAGSEFIKRLHSNDPEERMPYKHAPLSEEEITILTKWVDEGAQWGKHWAYESPRNVPVPMRSGAFAGLFGGSKDQDQEWAKNDIDYFVLDKLKKEKLAPSPAADKITLLRRVSLDLTGLPPSTEMVQRFLADNSANAYEKVVDTLLASPRYGERWAAMWLDLARYADTKGYEKDQSRRMWRYRDWVIAAFNKDLPFDQFTIDQLAGDLLPDPTDEQLIATAFNRNTMNNDEGGTDDEEFRTATVIDRVATTWDVWQSTTIACVQCHSHPYDPIKFEDFYKSYAFFNNTRDEDVPGEHPVLRFYNEVQQQEVADIAAWMQTKGIDNKAQKAALGFLKTLEPKIHPHSFDLFTNGALADGKWLSINHNGSCRIKQIRLDSVSDLILNYWTGNTGGSVEIHIDSLKGPVIAKHLLAPTKGALIVEIPLQPTTGKHDLYFVFRNPSIPPTQAVCGAEWLTFRGTLPGKGLPGYKEKEEQYMKLVNTWVDGVPVMVENTADQFRTTQLFERGNWLVKGDTVTPGVPTAFNPFPENAPKNRLGFAQWLISKDNPLTARVMVNRYWEQLFGIGIVETIEDFGSQGFAPSHPELLDWLAYRFMNTHQWSSKKLLKDMVMSATYQQDARATKTMMAKDPANRLLARGPRVRLTAEQVRDQALAVCGLLSSKMGGPGVMPWQPEGVWQTVYSGESWKTSEGEDQYRRGVYTFLKRTSPYPSFITFDGSSREVCLQRRIRTNTPLQALSTLNDPVFMDAARHLADVMIKKGGKDVATCIREGYKAAMLSDIPVAKLQVLEILYKDAFKRYGTQPEAAKQLLHSGEALPHNAALVMVANAIMNLDEFLTKS
jgi:hypothetical protein